MEISKTSKIVTMAASLVEDINGKDMLKLEKARGITKISITMVTKLLFLMHIDIEKLMRFHRTLSSDKMENMF
jgi:hypothetical protein